jgi:hypothetical protein
VPRGYVKQAARRGGTQAGASELPGDKPQVHPQNSDIINMSNPPAPASLGTPFAPRLLVQVRIGPATIGLYPVVYPSMPPQEHAHAFHINKTALAAQNINIRLQLDALGMQLNLSATVDGTINDWFRFFYDSWFDFSKLTILSFHNVKGNIVQDTTDAADPMILLPVQDGVLSDCRKKEVKFVHVQLTLDFSPLVDANPIAGPTILRAEYYVLHQTSTDVMPAHQRYRNRVQPTDVPWSQ